MTSGKCDLQFGLVLKALLEHNKLIFAVSLQQLWFWGDLCKALLVLGPLSYPHAWLVRHGTRGAKLPVEDTCPPVHWRSGAHTGHGSSR